jgi:hypothetical protein
MSSIHVGTTIEQEADSQGTDGEARPEPLPRREVRQRRRNEKRSRRTLIAAVLVTGGLPIVMIASLWNNLTLPFYFNEQWRAYYISVSGNWWVALQGRGVVPSGPFPAGWYFLERVSAWIFGSTELVMRLTTAMFLPLGCVLLMLLARRWMPLVTAVIVALAGGLTGTLTVYAVQLAPYEVDFAAVVAVVLLHEIATDHDSGSLRSVRVYVAYAGIAAACVFSTPAIFIAAPIFLLDVVRAARGRALTAPALGACGAGLVALLHLKLFVVPQSALTKSAYWDPQFLPHAGIGSQLAFVWDGLRGYVTGTFTASDSAHLPELLSPRLSWIVAIAFGIFLCIGIAVLTRTARGRTVLVAIVGSLGLTLIASFQRYWPFGFVRTNFYLVPLLILIAGVGAARAGSFLLERIRQYDPPSARQSLIKLAAVGLSVVLLAGVVLAVVYEVGTYRQVNDAAAKPAYGYKIASAVAAANKRARPGSALVVAGLMATGGWEYYQYEYTGRAVESRQQLSADHSVYVRNHGSPAITRFVRQVNPKQLFLYVPYGTTGAELDLDAKAIAEASNCRTVIQSYYDQSGLLYTMSCRGG